MDKMTRVQVFKEAVGVSLHANAFEKGFNQYLILSAMGN